MVESKKLKHFITLAKLGNFNEAAEVLHITQPALTRSIQSLETSLDVALFDRSQRAIKLTDAGSYLLNHAQAVMLDLENLSAAADRLRSLKAGKLVIGTGPLPADHIGAKACARFLSDYPDIHVRLVVDEPHNMVPKMINNEIDLMISDPRAILDFTDLIIDPLPAVPAVTVARMGHPLSHKQHLTFDNIRAYPCATISTLISQAIANAVNISDPREIADVFSYECNSVQLLLTTLKHSDAIGILLSSNIQEELKRNEVCVLDVPDINRKVYSGYGVVTYKPRLMSLAAEKFIEVVKHVAAEQLE